VFPHVTIVRGPGGYGAFMLGSDEPIVFTDEAMRSILSRPGLIENLSEPPDTPARSVDAWVRLIPSLVLLEDEQIDAQVGSGPMVTDDRPYSEYFLLRRLGITGS
jgi:hypothetical protein